MGEKKNDKMDGRKNQSADDMIFDDATPLYKPRKENDGEESNVGKCDADVSASSDVEKKTVAEAKSDSVGKEEKPAKRPKRDPQERVEHMNGLFDRLVLPMIIFTVLVFAGFGILPKLFGSCDSCKTEDADTGVVVSENYSFFSKRSDLLSEIDKKAKLLEKNGYMLVENEGRTVAYKELGNGMEIMENLADKNGNMYSVVTCVPEDSEASSVTMMIYSRNLYLVAAKTADGTVSAIFENDDFSPDVSAADAEQSAFLEVVPRELLVSMLTEYKDNFSELLK